MVIGSTTVIVFSKRESGGELDSFKKLGSNSPHLGKYMVSKIPLMFV